jgi:hypothetical protein
VIAAAIVSLACGVAQAALSAALSAGSCLPVVLALVAPGGEAPAHPEYRYQKPFLQPLPVWNDWQWPWLLVPLCVGVAVVYKSIKCRYVRQIPREATVLSVWILLGMASAAAVLAAVVKWLEVGG